MCNILNVGHFVVNLFDNTFNFCVGLSVGRLNEKGTCSRCRRMLKLSADHRDHTTTPVVLCCSNKPCPKDYYSIRDGTFLKVQSCLWSGKTVWLPGLCRCPEPQCRAYSTPEDCSWLRGGLAALFPNKKVANWSMPRSSALQASVLGHLGLEQRPFRAGIS